MKTDMNIPRQKFLFASVTLCLLNCSIATAGNPPRRELLGECGRGYLERVDGCLVLHLAGTPEQMGRQHGTLLREMIQRNFQRLLTDDDRPGEMGEQRIPRSAMPAVLCPALQDYIPAEFLTELRALAKAAELDEQVVIGCNLIPELFHCSGFALLSEASADHVLYHGRLLDYAVKFGLQDVAVLIIQEPDGGVPFVNVSYAGFVGSVTGMNLAGLAIGEMGGKGQGQWDGVPMSFLVRTVLQQARTLQEAIKVFTDNPRTCEYYYVISDANIDDAVGMKATPQAVEIIRPGVAYPELPTPVPGAVILSAGRRYHALVARIRAGFGHFTDASAIRLMDAPVAMAHNLHNALMRPGEGVLYVAHAASDGAPAWQQTYHRFDLRHLIANRPDKDPSLRPADQPQPAKGRHLDSDDPRALSPADP